jgi:DNA adenine methylase
MEALNFEPIRPVIPVAPYIGGKKNLARRLCSIIDQIDCATYAEPFVGMGGVFLRRSRRPKAEVINDISEDVSTFFRILQRHYVPFMDMLRFQLTTRSEFERLIRTDPSTLTDLERSARFLYLQRTAFGGKVDVTKLGPILEALHERLAPVTVERLPYEAFIRRYDRAGTLFYLDPPYFGCEGDYGAGVFAPEDFARLDELLAGISGRFIMSINDAQAVRDIFARYWHVPIPTTYTISSGPAKPVGELIIANFDIDAAAASRDLYP